MFQDAKTDSDIRKLRLELHDEQVKVHSLTSQLSTNSHVVAAFEQSLANMTARLQHITLTAERKDSELAELRRTIDRLRQSGADAGLIRSVDQLVSHRFSVSDL
jgi:neuron navigator 2